MPALNKIIDGTFFLISRGPTRVERFYRRTVFINVVF